MATNTEKIDELNRLVAALVGRVDKIESEVEWTSDLVEKLRAALEEQRVWRASVERDVADLKSHRDEWGRRSWTIVMALLTAFIGGVVGYLLKR